MTCQLTFVWFGPFFFFSFSLLLFFPLLRRLFPFLVGVEVQWNVRKLRKKDRLFGLHTPCGEVLLCVRAVLLCLCVSWRVCFLLLLMPEFVDVNVLRPFWQQEIDVVGLGCVTLRGKIYTLRKAMWPAFCQRPPPSASLQWLQRWMEVGWKKNKCARVKYDLAASAMVSRQAAEHKNMVLYPVALADNLDVS